MNLRTLTALGCIGVILAACGGGGDGGGGDLGTAPGPTAGGGTTSPAGIPSTALQSVDAFVAYLRQLAVDETSEPLPLPDAALPTSEAAEPA